MAEYVFMPVPGEMEQSFKNWNRGRRQLTPPKSPLIGLYPKRTIKGHSLGRGALHVVQETERLYVLAHGISQAIEEADDEQETRSRVDALVNSEAHLNSCNFMQKKLAEQVRNGEVDAFEASKGLNARVRLQKIRTAAAFVGGTGSDGKVQHHRPSALAKLLKAQGLRKNFVDLRVFSCNTGFASPAFGGKSYGQALYEELVKDFKRIRVTAYLGSVTTSYEPRQRTQNAAAIANHQRDFVGRHGGGGVDADRKRKGIILPIYDDRMIKRGEEWHPAHNFKVVYPGGGTYKAPKHLAQKN